MQPMKVGPLASNASVEEYINHPRWVMEQKMDGARAVALAWRRGGEENVQWLQSAGKPLKFAAAAQHLEKVTEHLLEFIDRGMLGRDYDIVLDGELMIEQGEYRVFDMPSLKIMSSLKTAGAEPVKLAQTPFEERRRVLAKFGAVGNVHTVKQFRTTGEKKDLYVYAQAAGVEGVVLKHLDGLYVPGTRSTDMLKVKFTDTADVVVMSWTRPDAKHGSADFGVYTDDGELVRIGSCSLIGKPEVEVGDVIEVEYLYWTGQSLTQPRMVRRRDDREATSCRFDQFRTYSRDSL